MSGKEKPAVTRPEASGRAGRKKASRIVVEAAAAADNYKLAPSGRPEQINDDISLTVAELFEIFFSI